MPVQQPADTAMTKTLSTYAAVLTACLLSASAYADTTQIHIYGSVRAPTCSAVTANDGHPVDFGEVDAKALRRDGFTTPISFDIKLIGCNTQTYSNASFKFKADTVANSSDYLIQLIQSVNHAQGVGIALKDQTGADIRFDDQTAFVYQIHDGTNSLSFEASLVSTGNNWDSLVPGLIAAQATFTVSYL